jgi:hypothetical protein
MKIKLFLLCSVFFTLSAVAQYGLTDNQRAGAQIGGPSLRLRPLTREQQAKAAQDLKIRLAGTQIFRVVDGKIYNSVQSTLWQTIDAKMYSYQKEDNVTILDEQSHFASGAISHHYLAITNYSGSETDRQYVNTLAMRIGNYDMGGRPIELYDCGKPYIPPPPTKEQIEAAKAAAIATAEREKIRRQEKDVIAIKGLLDLASNGSASAQCSLGIHYLNGRGCETNKEQAIFWLQKAAAQDDSEASNKLSELKSP